MTSCFYFKYPHCKVLVFACLFNCSAQPNLLSALFLWLLSSFRDVKRRSACRSQWPSLKECKLHSLPHWQSELCSISVVVCILQLLLLTTSNSIAVEREALKHMNEDYLHSEALRVYSGAPNGAYPNTMKCCFNGNCVLVAPFRITAAIHT